MLNKRIIKVGLLVVAASVVALAGNALVSAGEAPARKVSALDHAPAAVSLPPAAAEWAGVVGKGARVTGSVKLLRSNLGSKHSDVYAYRNGGGGVCYLYVGYAGTCSNARHLRRTGAQWTIGAGTFVALITDDVQAVALSVDGSSYPTSVENNIAFAEFPSDADTAVIHVSYATGETQSSTVRLGLPPGTPAPRPNSHP